MSVWWHYQVVSGCRPYPGLKRHYSKAVRIDATWRALMSEWQRACTASHTTIAVSNFLGCTYMHRVSELSNWANSDLEGGWWHFGWDRDSRMYLCVGKRCRAGSIPCRSHPTSVRDQGNLGYCARSKYPASTAHRSGINSELSTRYRIIVRI